MSFIVPKEMIMKKTVALLFLLLAVVTGKTQLLVDNTTFTPEQLVQNILGGPGVTISNVTLNGVPAATVSEMTGYFDGSTTNVGLNSGVLLGTGDVQVATGPNDEDWDTM